MVQYLFTFENVDFHECNKRISGFGKLKDFLPLVVAFLKNKGFRVGNSFQKNFRGFLFKH